MAPYWSKIPSRADWVVPFIVAALSLALSGWVSYNNSNTDIDVRVSKLETQRLDDATKIDHIQTQVDKLVEWALGHK